MYDRLAGRLLSKQPTRIVVDVGGVGYELTVPLSSFEALPPEGAEVTIYTHLHVREDSLRLFGYATEDERRFFRRLLDVQGIGPAVALTILSSTRYADFRDAVLTEDVALLTKMKGVGRKLAQRMILDLRDALAKEAPDLAAPGGPSGVGPIREDAVAALVTLGFTKGAAVREVDRILSASEGASDLGEIVRQALKTAR